MNVIDGQKLTIKEACSALYVSRSTINRWMRVGIGGKRLPSIKLGGKRLLLREDIEAFAEREGETIPA